MIEDIFEGSFADTLKRVFVPCKRVISESGCCNSGIFSGNKVIRNFVASDYPECTVEKGGHLLLDYGKELAGGIKIVTSRRGVSKVRIRFGESVSECCGEPNRDHAFHDAELTLPAYATLDFGNTGFRFVRLDVLDGTCGLLNVIAIAEMRELEKSGTFVSSDERLNLIYDTAVHTVHLNIQDFIYDGIKRDRLIWGGDMHPEVAAVLNTFGAIDEIDKSLEQLCFHTAEGKYINNLSSYPLWVLLCIHDLWFYSGKQEVLEKYAPFILRESERFVSVINPDGTFDMPGEHLFLDWPSDHDKARVLAGLQGLLALALSAAGRMKKALGREDGCKEFKAVDNLKKHVLKSAPHKTASALQHLAGIADRREVFEQEPFNDVSTFLGYYLLLAKENRAALELVKTYWGGMLDMGATSFWEDFDLKWCTNATRIDEMPVSGRPDIHADFGDHCYKGLRHSLCHGWAAGPAAWCAQKILGVSPAEPGFKKVKFTPDLCGLEWAKGTVPTPYGVITVSLEKGKAPNIILPSGTELSD
ncbi:MAG: alpha-L-rhamnosidase [Lentisphaeria bacterium]|nr:alpha-L-rhamnosidase [Lentisphaeria bacterium]